MLSRYGVKIACLLCWALPGLRAFACVRGGTHAFPCACFLRLRSLRSVVTRTHTRTRSWTHSGRHMHVSTCTGGLNQEELAPTGNHRLNYDAAQCDLNPDATKSSSARTSQIARGKTANGALYSYDIFLRLFLIEYR